jgi:diadenosine tetraphosphatase ApaH/serine/threonine PP2A family protein phosphatase
VVAHAGLSAHLHGDDSRRSRAFALYGDTTGEVDALGHPQRRDWAQAYAGAATVVYGHTPVDAAVWRNRTLNIDTGCVFGGALTAVLYPEGETVSVPAVQAWWQSPSSAAAPPTPEGQG